MCTILGKHLLADTLVAVLGYGMCYFMSQYHSQFIIRRNQLHQSFVHYNLSAGHTERIDFVTLYQIEFPGKLLDFVRKSVAAQVSFCGCGNVLSHSYHHGCLGSIGRLLGAFYIVVVLSQARRKHFLV